MSLFVTLCQGSVMAATGEWRDGLQCFETHAHITVRWFKIL